METISAKELDQYITDGRTLIVDLRSPADYSMSHVRGAINVPYGNFQKELDGRKRQMILLYCERGSLSMSVARDLERMGFQTKSVVGGIRAYRGKNLVKRDTT